MLTLRFPPEDASGDGELDLSGIDDLEIDRVSGSTPSQEGQAWEGAAAQGALSGQAGLAISPAQCPPCWVKWAPGLLSTVPGTHPQTLLSSVGSRAACREAPSFTPGPCGPLGM